jgi:hypothetical protein
MMRKTVHTKTRRRCRAFALVVATWMMVSAPQVVGAWRNESDAGYIESIEGGLIYVQGVKGLHVLEVLRECLWCKEGLEVTVTFSGYGRATLRPTLRSRHEKSIRAFLYRDGRMEH